MNQKMMKCLNKGKEKQTNKKLYENEQGFQSLCENCTQDRFSF